MTRVFVLHKNGLIYFTMKKFNERSNGRYAVKEANTGNKRGTQDYLFLTWFQIAADSDI